MAELKQKIVKIGEWLIVGIFAFATSSLGYGILKYNRGRLDRFTVLMGIMFLISLAATLFIFFLIKKKQKERATGVVIADEFTKKASVYAGYYAFCANMIMWSIYTVLGQFIFKDVYWLQKASPVMTITFIVTIYTYVFSFYYLKKTGNFHE